MTRIIDQINHCNSDSRLSKSTKNMRCHEVAGRPGKPVHPTLHNPQQSRLTLGPNISELMPPGGEGGGGGSSKFYWSVQSPGQSLAKALRGQAPSPACQDLPCAARGQRVITTKEQLQLFFFLERGGSKSHHSHALRLSLGDTVPDCPPQETKIAPK